jgi:hypothetical protein
MTRVRDGCLGIGLIVAAVFLPLASTPSPSSQPSSSEVDSAAIAFPNGLPAGSQLLPNGDVLFADGAILRFNVTSADQGITSSSEGVASGDQVSALNPCCSNVGVACPDTWVCLYEHWYFNRDRAGRMLQFHDEGYWQDLSYYSFNNMMSSWRNKHVVYADARWAYGSGGGTPRRCMDWWTENPWVGTTDNDQASSIYIYTSTNICGAP